MSVYGKSHPAKRQSAALTDGVDRAPARAMLKGVGFTDDPLAEPPLGLATTWSETKPRNRNTRLVAGSVKPGARQPGRDLYAKTLLGTCRARHPPRPRAQNRSAQHRCSSRPSTSSP